MIRYVVSRFQQRLTAVNIRAYASSGKVLVPRIPQPRDEMVPGGAQMQPPLLPPCPHKLKLTAPEARTTPYPKDPVAAQAQPKVEPQPHPEHHEAGHDEVVNNIGGAEISLLHH
jgi:hypothetical protein